MGIGAGPMAVAKPSTEAISTWVVQAIRFVSTPLRFRWNGSGKANSSTTGAKPPRQCTSTSGMGFCGGLILSSQTRLSFSKIQTRPVPTPILKANCLRRRRLLERNREKSTWVCSRRFGSTTSSRLPPRRAPMPSTGASTSSWRCWNRATGSWSASFPASGARSARSSPSSMRLPKPRWPSSPSRRTSASRAVRTCRPKS